ncbi:hypothetical protein CRI94_01670 [Longibacter salinarum]|uniref:6-bladed beta-propeller n=2 Tax=Longibacter salinarum TaxID=1850348 RepID=A0A2A8D223_9BACT|nr:hypothetical protein CRI94_01670 [Longibacter salinarum]
MLMIVAAACPVDLLAQRRPPGSPPPESARRAPELPLRPLLPAVTEEDVEIIGRFGDATSLASTATDLFYVSDAQQSTVTAIAPTGKVIVTLGGRGSEAGAFDEPLDVDPSNGLEIFVADAGNGRIQHFSRSGKYIESLPVGRVDPGNRTSSRQPLFDASRDGVDARADGRPIRVYAASSGDIYVLDARDKLIVRYDRQRRVEPFAGGFDARDGRLVDPIAMTMVDDRLVVADAGRGELLLFDRFGSFDGIAPIPPNIRVRNLVADDDELWIVAPERIVVFDIRRGRPIGTIPVTLGEPLVDVDRLDGMLALLTPTRLLLARNVRLPR